MSSEQNDGMLKEKGRRKNIEELFADYQGEYVSEEIEWGDPVGLEIW